MSLRDKLTIPIAAAIVPIMWLVGVCIWCPPVYGWWTAAIIAGAVVALPFSSLMHELGHMIFGAICKIKAVPKFKLFGSSSCKIIPKTDKNLRKRLIVTTIGGPVINLLFFIGSIIAICFSIEYSVLLPASWYLLIINLVPTEYPSGKTDALVLSELISNDNTAKVMLAVLTVQAQVLKGKPIAEVDEQLLFGVPQIIESEESFIALTELRYEYFKAKGETDKAEQYKARFEKLKKEYM